MIDKYKDKKILEMTYPSITTNPYTTNKLSVLVNHEETFPWFYSNFIQFWALKKGPNHAKSYWFDFLFYNGYRFCPFYKRYLMDKKLLEFKWDSIIDFVIESIDLDYYIYLNINTSYIPEYKGFEKNVMHDIFVYGYDKSNKKLNVADFFDKKYSYANIDFEDFKKAYYNLNLTNEYDFLEGVSIEAYKYADYAFDINFVINSITDFLHSRNTTINSDLNEFDNKDDICYGLEVYNVFINYLEEQKNSRNFYVDLRGFHMIYDHKKTMALRIDYLHKIGYILNPDQIISIYKELEKECLKIRNYLIKLIFSRNIQVFDICIEKLNNIVQLEEKALNIILKSIKKL